MGTLLLIRHGQANFGGSDYDQLSPLGLQQSRILGQYFAGQGMHFDAIYSGQKRRQQQTAAAALTAMGKPAEFGVLSAFNEFDAEAMLRAAAPQLIREDPALQQVAEADRHNFEHFKLMMSRVLRHWVSGTLEDADHLESWVEFLQRIQGGLETLLREEGNGRRIVVFTSGGPISAALHTLSAHYPAGLNWDVSNTSISTLSYRSAKIEQVQSAYTTPHLLAEQITYI